MTAPKPAEEKYTCGVCGKEYTKPPGYDEIALAKMKERYGDIPEDQRAIVCDACWRKAEPLLSQTPALDAETLRILHVIRDMQSRGHRVVGLIGVRKDTEGTEMELVWGSADDDITDQLEEQLVKTILTPTDVGRSEVRAKVDEKEGLTWEDKPWKEVN